MALTIVEPIRPYKPMLYGVAIRLLPGRDSGGTIWRDGYEVQRAPDSGGTPGTPIDIFATTRPLAAAGGVFVDQLSPTALYFHYRWRHVGPSVGAGAYSPYLKLAADYLSQAVLDQAVNNSSVYPLRPDAQMAGAGRSLLSMTTPFIPNAELDLWDYV